jgi:hypothetical protein
MGKRNDELKATSLERRFDQSGARARYNKRRKGSSVGSWNNLPKQLIELLRLLREPVFAQAYLTLAAYGLLDGLPFRKRLQKLGTLIADDVAFSAVRSELEFQRTSKPSLRKAAGNVAAAGVLDAKSLEAGRKRVQRAHTARREQRVPSGCTGREFLVGRVAKMITRKGPNGRQTIRIILEYAPTWEPDDRWTRRVFFHGDHNEVVVLNSRESKRIDSQAARQLADARRLLAELEEYPAGIAYQPRGSRPPTPRNYVFTGKLKSPGRVRVREMLELDAAGLLHRYATLDEARAAGAIP